MTRVPLIYAKETFDNNVKWYERMSELTASE